jgi:hypothetical protein
MRDDRSVLRRRCKPWFVRRPSQLRRRVRAAVTPRGQGQMTEKATSRTNRRNVGEIIQRGRIYYIRYYDGQGRRRLETTKNTKREDAEKQLRKRLSAKDAGVLPEAAIG